MHILTFYFSHRTTSYQTGTHCLLFAQKNFSWAIQKSFGGVPLFNKGCFRGVSKQIESVQGASGGFNGDLEGFRRSFKGISERFQVASKCLSVSSDIRDISAETRPLNPINPREHRLKTPETPCYPQKHLLKAFETPRNAPEIT